MKRWKPLLLGLAIIGIAVVLYDRCLVILWIGSTDLEVEFVVVDEETGGPIEGVEIAVAADTWHYADKGEFTLRTDGTGTARRFCPGVTCTGRDSGLGFTDAFQVYPLEWQFRVSAPGYQPIEWERLSSSKHWHPARLSQPRTSKVTVRVPLKRE